MAPTFSPWHQATINTAINAVLTNMVDLQYGYEYLQLIVPTINTSKLRIQVCRNSGGDFLQVGSAVSQTSDSAGDYATTLSLGGFQFFKLYSVHAQNTNIAFDCRGYTP